MSKCKKVGYFSGSIILVIVLIVLIAPYFLGLAAQKSIKKVVANLPKQDGISVQIKSYDRDWFTSKALIQVALDPNASPQAVWQYQIQNKGQLPPKFYLNITTNIWHGPFIFAKDLQNKWHFSVGRALAIGQIQIPNAERQLMLAKYNINTANNQESLFISLMGDMNLDLQLPNLTIAKVDGSRDFALSGLTLNYTVSPDVKSQVGNMHVKQITFKNQDNVIQVNDIKHQFDLKRDMSHLWTGKANLSVDEIKLSNGKQIIFDQKSVDLSSDASIKDKLLSLKMLATTGALVFEDKEFSSGSFQFQLSNFGAKAVNQLRILNEQLQSQKVGTTQYVQGFYHLAPSLFGYGAQIHLAPCELNTPYGKLSFGLNATFPNIQKDKITDNKVLFKNVESMNQLVIPQKLLSIILTKYYQNRLQAAMQYTDTAAPKEMTPEAMDKLVASKVEATISNWQQQNYLISKDGNFVINVNYKQGQLDVNGQAIVQ